MRNLEDILPEPAVDTVDPSMAGPRAGRWFTLASPAMYEYLESRRVRFGWLVDPTGITTTVHGTDGVTIGPLHWFILLRHGRGGWRVDKAHPHTSIASARMSASMEWAGREGYLTDSRDGRAILGPHWSDIADPARYLKLMKASRADDPQDR